ncbi:MAG: hypothetical protein QM784_31660 [Polyangiaceae bacterium]
MQLTRELRLSPDEAELLLELLKGDEARLVQEINHTDRREYREVLKQRETLLEGVMTRMQA